MADQVKLSKGCGAPIRPNELFCGNCGAAVADSPHDVIISHATTDKSAADAVCAKLEASGIRCWIAPRDILPSENHGEAIIKAIDSAKIMVLIFSSQANASANVMRETERAVHDGIPIIPFRIEDVQPSHSLQYYIGPQHWLDALTPPLEVHILTLAEVVTFLLGTPLDSLSTGPVPAAPPVRPLSKPKVGFWARLFGSKKNKDG